VTWRGGDQVIPRPPGAEPGGPAPWADIPPEKRAGFTIDRVVAGLKSHSTPLAIVPDVFIESGPSAEVAPEGPSGAPPGSIPSAVLVALFEENGEARVILTRRAKALRFHQGEVSFPGGRQEPGETPEQCALREAHEETGLVQESVELVGRLSSLTTFSSRSWITPVVGILPARPVLSPSPSEVDRVLDVELAALVEDGVFREERWNVRVGAETSAQPSRPGPGFPALDAQGSFPVWFFELPGDTVWGATARVLVELLRSILG
jgi:8-oxo-dGTP pyrophosphatase MutT (NUDIX family)